MCRSLAVWPEALEAEMNETCPVHGLRRFGPIVILDCVKPDGTESENTMKMCQLIESHRIRLAQHSHPALSLKKKMTHKNPNSRCKALAKSGQPCRASAYRAWPLLLSRHPRQGFRTRLGRNHHGQEPGRHPGITSRLSVTRALPQTCTIMPPFCRQKPWK